MQFLDGQRSLPSPVPRRVAVGLALAALSSLALLAAGCGGSTGQGVAQVGTTETTSTESGSPDGSSSVDPTAYSACMRKHGVPKFPDPDKDGALRLKAGPGTGIDPESAQFKGADTACRKLGLGPPTLSPAQQAEDRGQLLAFSACMRKNGVPNFPDPTFNPDGSGGITLERGLDRTPQFKAAEQACEKVLPGGPSSRDSEGGTP
jgi:hypothetical protein